MNVKRLIGPGIAAVVFGALWLAIALCEEPQTGKAPAAEGDKAAAATPMPEDLRVDAAIARDRAKQMYDIYSTTLDVIHHRYFHGDRTTIPARAMEDVFSEMKRRSKVEARWISVNTKAMSIDHDPKTDFEKRAAKEIAEGKTEIETIEDGYYRRAGGIALHSGCLSCHEGLFQSSSKKQRFAGLVISVPIEVGSGKAK
jgi:hypothetical protein